MSNIKYVGLDVHAESIAVAVADSDGGEVRALGMIPNERGAIRKALKKVGEFSELKVCYEAGPCGYVLYWQLKELGIECMVVAPTLIPMRSGDRVKTDKRDAIKLARFLRSGELTAVWVPDAECEALRNLVRARKVAKQDERRAKNRLTKFLLRAGKRPAKKTKGFGVAHCAWLRLQGPTFSQTSDQVSYEEYLSEWENQHERVKRFDGHLQEAMERMPKRQKAVVQSLMGLKGVAKITAMTATAEVGSFSRFASPRQLMAYAGVVPSEYSSGKSVHRGGISKTGNKLLRHAITESAWLYRHGGAGAAIKERRQSLSAGIVSICQKADKRLARKYRGMIERGKPTQKAATATSRELLGFMWAVACAVEAKFDEKKSA
jgi:transposase